MLFLGSLLFLLCSLVTGNDPCFVGGEDNLWLGPLAYSVFTTQPSKRQKLGGAANWRKVASDSTFVPSLRSPQLPFAFPPLLPVEACGRSTVSEVKWKTNCSLRFCATFGPRAALHKYKPESTRIVPKTTLKPSTLRAQSPVSRSELSRCRLQSSPRESVAGRMTSQLRPCACARDITMSSAERTY